ncbi:MAG: amino acid ABC transporter [Rhodospirillaceae bacterium]|nr:amino acid ABC transporter [Rhodospirillales bacterium]
MRHCRFAIVIAVFGLVAASASAGPAFAGQHEIEYAYPDQSVWTTKLDERGDPANPLLAVATKLFAKANIPWHGKSYPAGRMFDNLRNGATDFSMLVKAPALLECCLFSKKPVTHADILVYRLGQAAPISGKADFTDKSVITIRGYSYGGLLGFLTDGANRVDNHVAAGHEAAFAMLAAGRAEYLIDYAGPASDVLAAKPISGLRFDLLTSQDVYLVLSKTYPDAAAVMDRLEAIAETLDGEAVVGKGARQTHGTVND